MPPRVVWGIWGFIRPHQPLPGPETSLSPLQLPWPPHFVEHGGPVPTSDLCVHPSLHLDPGHPATWTLPTMKSLWKCSCPLRPLCSDLSSPPPSRPRPCHCQGPMSPSGILDILLLFACCLFPPENQQHEGRDLVMSTALSLHREQHPAPSFYSTGRQPERKAKSKARPRQVEELGFEPSSWQSRNSLIHTLFIISAVSGHPSYSYLIHLLRNSFA